MNLKKVPWLILFYDIKEIIYISETKHSMHYNNVNYITDVVVTFHTEVSVTAESTIQQEKLL